MVTTPGEAAGEGGRGWTVVQITVQSGGSGPGSDDVFTWPPGDDDDDEEFRQTKYVVCHFPPCQCETLDQQDIVICYRNKTDF